MSQEKFEDLAPEPEKFERGELYSTPFDHGEYLENFRATMVQAVEKCVEEGPPKEGMIKFKRLEDPADNGTYKVEFFRSHE